LDNGKEIDIFFDIYNLPKLNNKDINNLNKSIISNVIKTVIKKLPKKNPWAQMDKLLNLPDVFKEELPLILCNLVQEM
jgi:peroxiredoxin family protein